MTWTCRICEPNNPTRLEGGETEFYQHYNSVHLADHYDTPKPAGFVPLPRAEKPREIPYVKRGGSLKSAEVRAELDG